MKCIQQTKWATNYLLHMNVVKACAIKAHIYSLKKIILLSLKHDNDHLNIICTKILQL